MVSPFALNVIVLLAHINSTLFPKLWFTSSSPFFNILPWFADSALVVEVLVRLSATVTARKAKKEKIAATKLHSMIF